jgi:AcrR family transcriptional regulator
MNHASPRRAGRPKQAILTRDLIIDSAFELSKEVGAEGFSMKQLADRLGVQPPALYNHVANRNEVVNAMRERIALSFEVNHFDDQPWYDALVPWAWAYRNAFAAHPQTIALLATLPLGDEEVVFLNYETIFSALRRQGWPVSELASVVIALESFIIGSALDVLAPEDNQAPGSLADRAPTMHAALEARKTAATAEGATAADVTFDVGLRLLIDGMRHRLQQLDSRAVDG